MCPSEKCNGGGVRVVWGCLFGSVRACACLCESKHILKIRCSVICGGGAAGGLNNSQPHSPEHTYRKIPVGGGSAAFPVVRRPGSMILAVAPAGRQPGPGPLDTTIP
jgi:hypothetical protein